MTKTKAQFRAQGRHNRNKGKAGQREFLRLFIAWLTGLPHDHPDQAIRYSSTQHHPDGFLDGSPVDSWHIETKKCTHWKLRVWIREAERDAGPARPWFIAARLPGVWWCHVPKEKREAVRWFIILPKAMLAKYLVGLPRWYELTLEGKVWRLRNAIIRQEMDCQQTVAVLRSRDYQHVRVWTVEDDPVRLWSLELIPEDQTNVEPDEALRWGSYCLIPARTWAYLVDRLKERTQATSDRASTPPGRTQGTSG